MERERRRAAFRRPIATRPALEFCARESGNRGSPAHAVQAISRCRHSRHTGEVAPAEGTEARDVVIDVVDVQRHELLSEKFGGGALLVPRAASPRAYRRVNR